MDLIAMLPAFVVAVVLISASPGPAMALILRRSALHGFRAAVPTVLGLELGLYLWALAAAGGLAVLVAASETAYLLLRVVGAAVLIYLGIRAFKAAWAERRALSTAAPRAVPHDAADTGADERSPRRAGVRSFTEGLVVQLANPKAAVFMLAFYPQFVPADRPLFATTAALALLQVVLETGLYLALAAGVSRAGGWFRTPRIRQRLEAVSGTVLIALGLRVAASSR
jgi:threonine/homoserine/homoserine lactone efflux protein